MCLRCMVLHCGVFIFPSLRCFLFHHCFFIQYFPLHFIFTLSFNLLHYILTTLESLNCLSILTKLASSYCYSYSILFTRDPLSCFLFPSPLHTLFSLCFSLFNKIDCVYMFAVYLLFFFSYISLAKVTFIHFLSSLEFILWQMFLLLFLESVVNKVIAKRYNADSFFYIIYILLSIVCFLIVNSL